jgi:hypothetical protein
MGDRNPFKDRSSEEITLSQVLTRSQSQIRRRNKGSRPLKTDKSSKSGEISEAQERRTTVIVGS